MDLEERAILERTICLSQEGANLAPVLPKQRVQDFLNSMQHHPHARWINRLDFDGQFTSAETYF